jgi:hypothetical protein
VKRQAVIDGTFSDSSCTTEAPFDLTPDTDLDLSERVTKELIANMLRDKTSSSPAAWIVAGGASAHWDIALAKCFDAKSEFFVACADNVSFCTMVVCQYLTESDQKLDLFIVSRMLQHVHAVTIVVEKKKFVSGQKSCPTRVPGSVC